MGFRNRYIYILLAVLIYACTKTPMPPDPPTDSLTDIPYNPVAYSITPPPGFPAMSIPADNPLTVDGIALGRHLFYDPILSADSTKGCFSCHVLSGSMTDNLAVSAGIDNINGRRSSMSLLNIGYYYNGLFWDGRSATLEEQAFKPVEDPIELHDNWDNVEVKLRRHATYPTMFRKAFGISNKSEITRDLAAKALAQFERTMISSGKSKYDLALKPGSGVEFTDEESYGYSLYYQLETRDGQCGHCHQGFLLTDNVYRNNALDEVANLNDFVDKGRGEVTNILYDNGKFRAPTLRNIALTAPYMHDGRFQTLEEVLDHYATGGHYSDNVDPIMIQLKNNPLTEPEKQAILTLLHTMTDTAFVNNPALKSPF
jgi:cytochrome c peroxidase